MFALAPFSAALNIFGGVMQAGNIRRQTALQVERMQKQANQAVGQATAVAGASGVEMTSSTVENHLSEMRREWNARIAQVTATGNEAAGMSILSSAGSAFGSLAKGMSGAAEELQNTNDAWRGYAGLRRRRAA